jgi:hypothetical protein
VSEERPFDGYLTLVQGNRPEALPRLAWHGADAVALVGADLVLVVGIEHFIGEGEDCRRRWSPLAPVSVTASVVAWLNLSLFLRRQQDRRQ